jgi:hypothetical protein
VRKRNVPTANEIKIQRLQAEMKRLRLDQARIIDQLKEEIDSLKERVVVKNDQVLIGHQPNRATLELLVTGGMRRGEDVRDAQPMYLLSRNPRVATFEWEKKTLELRTGNPDPSNPGVYVTWFVPVYRGITGP